MLSKVREFLTHFLMLCSIAANLHYRDDVKGMWILSLLFMPPAEGGGMEIIMALIRCPECGRRNVSDRAFVCPRCGFGIRDYYENKKEENTTLINIALNEEDTKQELCNEISPKVKKNNNKKFIYLLIACICLFIGIFMIIASPIFSYLRANKLFEAGNYQEAKLFYVKLGDYKDAPERIKECEFEIIREQIYSGKNLREALYYLNSNELTNDTKALKLSCLWQLSQETYATKNYLQTIRYLDEIGELAQLENQEESANTILEDSLYNYAVNLYEAGDFSQAILYFNRLKNENSTYEEYTYKSKLLFDIQGKWYSSELHAGLDIEGWNIKKIWYSVVEKDRINKVYNYNIKDWEINRNELIYFSQYSTGLEHYDIYQGMIRDYWTDLNGSSKDLNYSYYYFSKTDELLEQKKEPFIGMTAEELKKSLWGEPNDINRTTYSWGVREQWCYSGYRYVYLEDGIVTSISE